MFRRSATTPRILVNVSAVTDNAALALQCFTSNLNEANIARSGCCPLSFSMEGHRRILMRFYALVCLWVKSSSSYISCSYVLRFNDGLQYLAPESMSSLISVNGIPWIYLDGNTRQICRSRQQTLLSRLFVLPTCSECAVRRFLFQKADEAATG